tara:strand:- start:191 stop:307 length:117 start_codon:yes stop_codon:yes gene_type:complete
MEIACPLKKCDSKKLIEYFKECGKFKFAFSETGGYSNR